MRHALVAAGFCAAASYAHADCPAPQTITAFGHTYQSGGLLGMLNPKDCDSHEQPTWLATINSAPASNGTQPGLAYCRQIIKGKEPEREAQRHDCIYWYGHSIEAP